MVGVCTRYSLRQRNQKYAEAVANYLTRQGVPATTRLHCELDIWFVDHDKKISQPLQLLITGFLAGLEEALYGVE